MASKIDPPANSAPLNKLGHITFHLAPADVWEQQRSGSTYRPEQFTTEGFIHCTDSVEEVISAGNRYYRSDRRPYLLLDVDCGRVAAPIVYEDDARIFPHIYGELETSAVTRARTVERSEDGGFVAIGNEYE